MTKGLLERLSEGIVLGDGGYIHELGKRAVVREGPYTPEVCLEYPEAVKELHREFLIAGAEVLQALAFYGSREKLAKVGFGDRVLEVNRAAVRLAREVAGDKALVAGNLSMTWDYVEDDSDSHEVVRRQFQEQLEVQIDEGIDFVICEFLFHLGEALIALDCAKKTGLPVMVTMTFGEKSLTKDGKSPAECAKVLMGEGADIVGVNCARGPRGTLPLVRAMRKAVDGYIAIQPAGYRTTRKYPVAFLFPGFPDAIEPYQATRFDMANCALAAKEMGVNYIGGCCGTIPAHVREMAKALGMPPQTKRVWQANYERPMSISEEYGAFKDHDSNA